MENAWEVVLVLLLHAIALDAADIKLSELSLGFGPFVIAPAVERKIGTAAFGSLAIDSTLWRNAEWALRKGLYSEMHLTTEALDESVARLSNALSHDNPEAMGELKEILWKGTEHWDKLLTERAAISGRLVLSDYTKTAIAKSKK
jgi:methylglutaconyl-CoA hydratase